jgi:hypothetical protein
MKFTRVVDPSRIVKPEPRMRPALATGPGRP